MYLSSNNNTNYKKKHKKDEQKDGSKEEINKFRVLKIEEMEQDEQVICTISKYSNVGNQYLASQKKNLLQPNYENGKRFLAEEEKRVKSYKISSWIE